MAIQRVFCYVCSEQNTNPVYLLQDAQEGSMDVLVPVSAKVAVLRKLTEAALQAVTPDAAVLRHLHRENNCLLLSDASGTRLWEGDLRRFRKIRLAGAGKGAAPMAAAVENLLGDALADGLIVVKYGHDLPPGQALRRTRVREGGHPLPDESGQQAADAILKLAESCGQEDLLLCVLTGGASSLTPALQPGTTLADMQILTEVLLQCGAPIQAINTLRKHLSRFSGGNLARAAYPATLLGLIVSDVVGDSLDVIASGPTVPDSTTFGDCLRILREYALVSRVPEAIKRHLESGAAGERPETPKAGDPVFERVRNVLVATVRHALEAAAQAAEAAGYRPRLLPEPISGEARHCAASLVAEALRVQQTLGSGDTPVCLLAGGESTVTLRGTGKGGRNQEMALAALLELEHTSGIAMICAGTDGTDGPTDAAGGFALSGDIRRIRNLGLDPQACLDKNDSYSLLEKAGCLLRTGPTRTNVMDIVIILVDPLR